MDGKVLAWGWGEHGNCGPGTTNGDVEREMECDRIISNIYHQGARSRILELDVYIGCASLPEMPHPHQLVHSAIYPSLTSVSRPSGGFGE